MSKKDQPGSCSVTHAHTTQAHTNRIAKWLVEALSHSGTLFVAPLLKPNLQHSPEPIYTPAKSAMAARIAGEGRFSFEVQWTDGHSGVVKTFK